MKHLKDCRNLANVPHNTILGEKIGNPINPNKYWGLIRFRIGACLGLEDCHKCFT